jgi:hypothetical protein
MRHRPPRRARRCQASEARKTTQIQGRGDLAVRMVYPDIASRPGSHSGGGNGPRDTLLAECGTYDLVPAQHYRSQPRPCQPDASRSAVANKAPAGEPGGRHGNLRLSQRARRHGRGRLHRSRIGRVCRVHEGHQRGLDLALDQPDRLRHVQLAEPVTVPPVRALVPLPLRRTGCQDRGRHAGAAVEHWTKRPVERVTGTAAGLGNEVAVQVHGRGDGSVAEPAGNFGDRHALSEGGAGERMPKIMSAP